MVLRPPAATSHTDGLLMSTVMETSAIHLCRAQPSATIAMHFERDINEQSMAPVTDLEEMIGAERERLRRASLGPGLAAPYFAVIFKA
jgi:hypothetical protein